MHAHYVQLHFIVCVRFPSSWLHKCTAFIVAQREQKEKPEPSWTQGTYIFNLLNFTYCLNGSCIFNDPLFPTDTAATIILALLLCCVVYACCQALFHLVPFPCDVKRGDLSNTERILEQQCQPSSTLTALGCSFMAASRNGIKDAEGLRLGGHWSVVLYSGIKMKNGPPAKCACTRIIVLIIITRDRHYMEIDNCLVWKDLNKTLIHFTCQNYHNSIWTFPMTACDIINIVYMWLVHLSWDI